MESRPILRREIFVVLVVVPASRSKAGGYRGGPPGCRRTRVRHADRLARDRAAAEVLGGGLTVAGRRPTLPVQLPRIPRRPARSDRPLSMCVAPGRGEQQQPAEREREDHRRDQAGNSDQTVVSAGQAVIPRITMAAMVTIA